MPSRNLWSTSLLLCAVCAAPACKSSSSGGDADAASGGADPTAATSASASPSASAAAAVDATPRKACTVVHASTSLDHGVRLDTGVTMVVMEDSRVALGYAAPDGTPKVVVVDDAGKAQPFEAVATHLKAEKKKTPKTVRTVLRVTPIAFAGTKIRVGIDLVDTNPDKTKYLRCGPADVDPYVSESPNEDNKNDEEGQAYDCRTFSNGHQVWVLAATGLVSEALEGEMPMAWLVKEKPGKTHVKDGTLDKKRYPAARFDHETEIDYQVPVGAGVSGTGYVFAARQEGALVVAQRNGDLQKLGDATRFALGGSVTMPAIAVRGRDAVLFTGLAGKTDLYGSRFALDAKALKPERLSFLDDDASTDGDRNSVSASIAPGGSVYVAFADGKSGQKRPRLARFTSDLKGSMRAFDVADSAAISEVRVHAITDTKVLVTYLEQAGDLFDLKSTLLDCPADASATLATGPTFPAATPWPASASSASAGGKKGVPKCPSGQSLFAMDDSSPVFCSKSCSTDADCKPSTCNSMLFGADDKTGVAYTGVGKQVSACDKGFGGSPGGATPSGALTVPPGGPAAIPNPKNLPCPAGYNNAGGVLKVCSKECALGSKCPTGYKCNEALLVCTNPSSFK